MFMSVCQELSFVQRCIEDEIGKRENVESERDAVKLLSVKLQNK